MSPAEDLVNEAEAIRVRLSVLAERTADQTHWTGEEGDTAVRIVYALGPALDHLAYTLAAVTDRLDAHIADGATVKRAGARTPVDARLWRKYYRTPLLRRVTGLRTLHDQLIGLFWGYRTMELPRPGQDGLQPPKEPQT